MRKSFSCPAQTGHRVPPEFEYDPVPALISGGLPSGLCFESSQLFLLLRSLVAVMLSMYFLFVGKPQVLVLGNWLAGHLQRS